MSGVEQIREVKELMANAGAKRDPADAVTDLVLAVNILIGLVEGHRHSYYQPNMVDPYMTGPMQALEGRDV